MSTEVSEAPSGSPEGLPNLGVFDQARAEAAVRELLLALGEGSPARLRVGVEEPGYPSLRRVPARFGATVVPVPVDERGLRVAEGLSMLMHQGRLGFEHWFGIDPAVMAVR